MIKSIAELGALPEPKGRETDNIMYERGWNDSLSDCAGRRIEVKWDREKLIEAIISASPFFGSAEWDPTQEQYQVWLRAETIDRIANAIITSENSILTIAAVEE